MELLRRTHKPRHAAASSFSFTAAAIRAMPYRIRLEHYEKEKNELFCRMSSMTAQQIHDEQQRIMRKWQI